jgi:hypothetical protein
MMDEQALLRESSILIMSKVSKIVKLVRFARFNRLVGSRGCVVPLVKFVKLEKCCRLSARVS